MPAMESVWKESLLWRGRAPLPCGVVRPHVVTRGTCVFVGGGSTGKLEFTRTIFKFEKQKNEWSNLPITPYFNFSMALVDDRVTVVGGVSVITSQVSNALASYEESAGAHGKWSHSRFPPMPTKRSCTSSTSISKYLVVVGGIGEGDDNYLNTVEVLDVKSSQWYTASTFPKPVTFMSISASSSWIYLTGGLTTTGAVRVVFGCSLDTLLNSCDGLKDDRSNPGQVWEEVAVAPCLRSGCCVVREKLVVFGGITYKHEGLHVTEGISSSVYTLDPPHPLATGKVSWRLVGQMAAKRSSMSLAVTGPSSVLMVGGYIDPRNWMNSLTTDVMEVVNLNI